jgi:hypothetical protein
MYFMWVSEFDFWLHCFIVQPFRLEFWFENGDMIVYRRSPGPTLRSDGHERASGSKVGRRRRTRIQANIMLLNVDIGNG